jgi:hypothetical protein
MRLLPLKALIAMTLAAVLLAGSPRAGAQDAVGPSRTALKCATYRKAWSDVLARRGGGGLGQEFLASHEAFVASGCTARGAVCPRTPEELDVANLVALVSMNAGTGGTFLPFSCRR